MYRQASRLLRISTRAHSTLKTKIPQRQNVTFLVASSSTVLIGISLYVLNQKPIHNDAVAATNSNKDRVNLNLAPERQNGLSPIIWGSNYHRLIDPDQTPNACFKIPTYNPNLFSSPLRDLAFSVNHAACIDARGDVYQWGDGFFGTDLRESRRPQLTLSGKNIVSLAITPKKIFALSESGKVFVLPSSQDQQSTSYSPPLSSWWSFFGASDPQPHLSELDTDVPLRSAERISAISAGTDHLLALTNHGRVFAHPVTRHANMCGQLGVRKITIQDPTDLSKRIPVELDPVRPGDERRLPRNVTASQDYQSSLPEDPINDKRVGYCDRLFEVPVLRGIEVERIATGDRTSFAVTRQQGRVLGWGANEFGQLGFGGNVTVPVVSVPTEVVLSRFTNRSTVSRCLDIAAGGDLTYFVVERDLPSSGETKYFDVLASGNGQWGGLGNGTYSNCQGEPVKVKNISGLMEYDESNNSLTPLRPYSISVAPGPMTGTGLPASTSGHAIAMLDTLPHSHPFSGNDNANDAAYPPGRDVITWGLNQHYQLGNGKRSGSNIPVSVRTSDGEGRLMCQVVDQQTLKDFHGRVVKRKGSIEQQAVAGPGFTVVYWKISP